MGNEHFRCRSGVAAVSQEILDFSGSEKYYINNILELSSSEGIIHYILACRACLHLLSGSEGIIIRTYWSARALKVLYLALRLELSWN